MKGYASLSPSQSSIIENAGSLDVGETIQLTNNKGYFNVCISLAMILGFAEDYRQIIINAKYECILARSRSDTNEVVQTVLANGNFEDFKIELSRID